VRSLVANRFRRFGLRCACRRIGKLRRCLCCLWLRSARRSVMSVMSGWKCWVFFRGGSELLRLLVVVGGLCRRLGGCGWLRRGLRMRRRRRRWIVRRGRVLQPGGCRALRPWFLVCWGWLRILFAKTALLFLLRSPTLVRRPRDRVRVWVWWGYS
jgi:hypothetical protein